MLVSYKWLQRYFDAELPGPEVLAEKLTFGAFEIEGIEKKDGDTIIDVKVLPDRACYALSHRGIAKEIATLTGIAMKVDPLREPYPVLTPETTDISVSLEDQKRTPYYAAALIRGVKVAPSPAWLRELLEALGQKSINNIVDATNFVMFDLGTPLHAFDADKLSGAIHVRSAKEEGEKITILGGQEKTVTKEMTLITDAKTDAPLALAGVKGGTLAELTSGTVNIILEAAKFDPTRTRKTASALNLKTDASKRFENDIARELPAYGMRAAVDLIVEIAGGKLVGYATTALPYKFPYRSGVSGSEVNRLLGTELSDVQIANLCEKLFAYERIDDPVDVAIEAAKAQLDKPFQKNPSFSVTVPHAFDCSSFVGYAYLMAGVPIPRSSVDQYLWGEPVSEDALKPGDLVFANTGEGHIWYASDAFIRGKMVPEGVDHVGMYIGAGEVIHATATAGKVLVEKLSESPRFKHIVGYRRMVENSPRFAITIPFERCDLRIPQDLIEEIGRVYGYGNIVAQELPAVLKGPQINPRWCVAEAVRKVLSELGFAEVYTYTLRADGEVKLANALAADKGTLRSALAPGMIEALDKSAYNAPLLALDTVRIYEMGNVFTKRAEEFHVCVGVRPLSPKKRAEKANAMLLEAKAALEKDLGVKVDHRIDAETLEFDLGAVVADASCVLPDLPIAETGIQYQPLSPYPFVLRDIALWVSVGVLAADVHDTIRIAAGPTLARIDQFDEFTKEGRTSYAFHLVFQSAEKTLTDAEAGAAMDGVNAAVKAQGWEVR